MWHHFEFTSGANPYIAFTDENAEANKKLWQSKGWRIEAVKEGFYKVHDEESGMDKEDKKGLRGGRDI